MAELIRVSYKAIEVIPQEHRRTLHTSYEDNDLEGCYEAERFIEWLQQEMPESFVGIMANNSVRPECCTIEGLMGDHFPCDYYDELWYTVLIPKKIWDEYKSQVEKADQAWKDAHQCKLVRA